MTSDWSSSPCGSRSASSSGRIRDPVECLWSLLAGPPALVVKMGERAGDRETGGRYSSAVSLSVESDQKRQWCQDLTTLVGNPVLGVALVMGAGRGDAGEIKPFFHLLVFDDTQLIRRCALPCAECFSERYLWLPSEQAVNPFDRRLRRQTRCYYVRARENQSWRIGNLATT